MKKPVVLIVEADDDLRRSLREPLARQGWDVSEGWDKTTGLHQLQASRPDIVIAGSPRDARSSAEAVAFTREIRRRRQSIPLILIAANSSEELAIAALRAGVTDYLKPPVAPEELIASVHRSLGDALVPASLARSGPASQPRNGGLRLIGESPSMRQIHSFIEQVASTDSTVLITGETGTGKDLVADFIHKESPRAGRPYVSINCAAIPESLLESELFGYERGAFTGAHGHKEGALKLANEGTAFFDEIGDMSSEGQAKILRAIESKEIHRLGGKGNIPLDLRVIAATNQDLEQRVAEGRFRKDLYFRLNVARICLPPLRDRKEDIPALLGHYIGELNRRLGREVEGLTEDAMEPLLRYDWPGNVRELKNLLEAIYVNLRSTRIAFADLPEPFRRQLGESTDKPLGEKDLVLSALLATRWNKSKAAQRLHWSRMTLYRKMAKYDLRKERRL